MDYAKMDEMMTTLGFLDALEKASAEFPPGTPGADLMSKLRTFTPRTSAPKTTPVGRAAGEKAVKTLSEGAKQRFTRKALLPLGVALGTMGAIGAAIGHRRTKRLEQNSRDKTAQEDRPPLAALAEDVATPAAFGTAGYYLAKHFGLGGKTGLPDWFTGPALGLGVAMPMLRDYLRPRRRTPEEQMRLEQQAQAMLAGPMGYNMGAYGSPKFAFLHEAFDKVGQAPTGFTVPGDAAEQVAQRGQQAVQQTAAMQQQQQMQQAVAASVAKGYLSALQQKQKPQQPAQPGARR